jgi:hypothetical protein
MLCLNHKSNFGRSRCLGATLVDDILHHVAFVCGRGHAVSKESCAIGIYQLLYYDEVNQSYAGGHLVWETSGPTCTLQLYLTFTTDL